MKLGQRLLNDAFITQAQLDEALAIQTNRGGSLGDILTHHGMVSPLHLYQTLAAQHDLPFINFHHQQIEASLLEESRIPDYLKHGFLPYKLEGDMLYVALTHPDKKEHVRYIAHDSQRIRYAVTSHLDIIHAIEEVFCESLTDNACHYLRKYFPHYSLTRHEQQPATLSPRQILLLCTMIYCCFWILSPSITIATTLIMGGAFFIACSAFKVILFMIGLRHRDAIYGLTQPPEHDDTQLPIYTVLVPMYHEAGAVKGLLHSLAALDYPAEKLDIKLIIEASDKDTLAAIKAIKPDRRFNVVVVPESKPQTKPKACNYALQFARGEFITIYDAEDAPDPQQLRRAVATFRAGGEQRACLQGRLNYYNHDECILTRLFSLEYAMLFDYMLPALYYLGIPIPLGGTSNHIRRNVLEQLGSWDAYNVTEDADLGVRMASEHYLTLPLDSLTQEEAPVSMVAWVKQRSRWIKGYLQTWSVMSRDHRTMRRQHGPIGFWGIHFFIGASSLSFVLAPILWTGSIIWWLGKPDNLMLPDWMFTLSIVVLSSGAVIQFCSAYVTNQDRGSPYSIWLLCCFPFYFLFHSIASTRSLWQLLVKPYHWDKTTHNISDISRTDLTIAYDSVIQAD